MVMQTGCNMLHIIYREGMVNPHEEGGSGQFLRVGKGGEQMKTNYRAVIVFVGKSFAMSFLHLINADLLV